MTDHGTSPYCPSCGADLDDLIDDAFDEDVSARCPQCERDLTLPDGAVKSQLCVVCKIPETDSDESVPYHDLDTGERICFNCLADLRSFKFDVGYLVLTAEWLTDEHTQAINGALFDLAEEHEGNYTDRGNTNAAHARMGEAATPRDEMSRRLEDLDEEQREELRDALDESG